jgi:hypothetical protein
MSRLDEHYPQARRLPSSDTSVDDAALLRLLQPYLGWVLAEIDTGSLDILICDYDETAGKPQHLVLLTGRAVAVWLRNASSIKPANGGYTPVG